MLLLIGKKYHPGQMIKVKCKLKTDKCSMNQLYRQGWLLISRGGFYHQFIAPGKTIFSSNSGKHWEKAGYIKKSLILAEVSCAKQTITNPLMAQPL